MQARRTVVPCSAPTATTSTIRDAAGAQACSSTGTEGPSFGPRRWTTRALSRTRAAPTRCWFPVRASRRSACSTPRACPSVGRTTTFSCEREPPACARPQRPAQHRLRRSFDGGPPPGPRHGPADAVRLVTSFRSPYYPRACVAVLPSSCPGATVPGRHGLPLPGVGCLGRPPLRDPDTSALTIACRGVYGSPATMRILFVSGTSTGGSARSPRSWRTAARAGPRRCHAHGVAAATGRSPGRGSPGPGPVCGPGLPGGTCRPCRPATVGGAASPRGPLDVPHVENTDCQSVPSRRRGSAPARCGGGDQPRPSGLALIRDHLAAAGTASVLYLRAEDTLRRLAEGPHPDLVVSNAHALADGARQLGTEAALVPSVVELDRCRVKSTRQRVLFVNPIAMRGLGIVLAMASARPAIPFVVHETAALDRRDRARLPVPGRGSGQRRGPGPGGRPTCALR